MGAWASWLEVGQESECLPIFGKHFGFRFARAHVIFEPGAIGFHREARERGAQTPLDTAMRLVQVGPDVRPLPEVEALTKR